MRNLAIVPELLRFGIEDEIPFIRLIGENNRWVDADNTSFEDLQQIIDQLPTYEADQNHFREGDSGIKQKRWYIEGYERFFNDGCFKQLLPKGIEIRTTQHHDLFGLEQEFLQSKQLLLKFCKKVGLTAVCCSYHPYCNHFAPNNLNRYEKQLRLHNPIYRADDVVMLSFGSDISFSCAAWSDDRIVAIAEKLIFYAPWLVSFSFNSPFCDGKLWDGYSVRTHVRSKHRPICRVFVRQKNCTKEHVLQARQPSEVGRIEFKAFDICPSVQFYLAFIGILVGIAVDTVLLKHDEYVNVERMQKLAKRGWECKHTHQDCQILLDCAANALFNNQLGSLCQPFSILQKSLKNKEHPAHHLIQAYTVNQSIINTLETVTHG